MEVMRVVVGVIQAAAAVVLLEAAVLLLQVAVIHQAVEALHQEVEGIRLEVAVTSCRQRSQVAVGLVVHLYHHAKRDMMSALRQTSLI